MIHTKGRKKRSVSSWTAFEAEQAKTFLFFDTIRRTECCSVCFQTRSNHDCRRPQEKHSTKRRNEEEQFLFSSPSSYHLLSNVTIPTRICLVAMTESREERPPFACVQLSFVFVFFSSSWLLGPRQLEICYAQIALSLIREFSLCHSS